MDDKQWERFLVPYRQAVEELKVKLKGIRTLYEYEDDHSPIEFVTGRVKPVASILEKARRKSIPLHEIETMQDIAGLRIMCQFVDDIQIVKDMLFARKDFTVVDQRDYIAEHKESGSGVISPSRAVSFTDGVRRKACSRGNTDPYTGDEFLGDH